MTMLRLRLRAWLGWGCAPDDLRVQSAQLFKVSWVMVLCGLFYPLFLLVGSIFYKPYGAYLHYLFTTRAGLFYGGFVLVIILLWLIPALSYRRLANQGGAQPPITVSGRCYRVVQGYSNLFARIGSSVETAQWYRLPLTWDAFVEPGDREYELTVNPATGFVELLRRLGASPQEVRQYSTREIESGQVNENYYGIGSQSDESRSYATEEQLRELERLAKNYRLDLATDPRSLLKWALFGLSLGLVFIFSIAGLMLIWLRGLLAPDAIGVFLLLLVIPFIFLTICLVSSLGALRDWNYVRRFKNEVPEHSEGNVLCWIDYDVDTLVQMRADDGSTEVFRIHRRWENRVRTPNQRFRVTYLPTTHRVLDVRLVDSQ